MTLNDLLKQATDLNASDLHLASTLVPRVRIDGELQLLANCPVLSEEDIKTMFHDVIPEEAQEALEYDFSFSIDGIGRFRTNIFHQSRGLSVVIRILQDVIPTLEDLGMPGVLTQLCEATQGLILITGPTGSGKSTTLASMLEHMNKTQRRHVITLEDPIEYMYESKECLIQQREVGRHTHSFNDALRSALREDPDVILVGETRDLETIRLALTAAETGHLVLATLHTSSAPQTIHRVVDVFPDAEQALIRSMLAESLKAVVSQILLKCKTGGRIAAHEIMLGTPAIQNLVREDKIPQIKSVIQTSHAEGMHTLDQSLNNLRSKDLIL